MWFLLLQIALLLLLAAFFGAAAAYLWMRGRFEDVSETYDKLVGRIAGEAAPASRDDLDAGLSAIGETVSARLAALPVPDLRPVEDRLDALEAAINRVARLEATMARMAEGVAALRNPDLEPLDRKIEGLGRLVGGLRAPDLAPIDARLAALSGAVERARAPDMKPFEERLARLEHAVASHRTPDLNLAPLAERLVELKRTLAEDRRTETLALNERLSTVASLVSALPKSDIAPLGESLSALERRLSGLEAGVAKSGELGGLADRLGALEKRIQTLPAPDFGPVVASVRAIDRRLDLAATENRLTSIEYGLAALHHMVRARSAAHAHEPPETVAATTTTKTAPAIDPANLLKGPEFGPADDLSRIAGVGPMLREMLNDIGVYYFWQIAGWTPADAVRIDGLLRRSPGRIAEENWIEQARALAASPLAARPPAAPSQGA